MIQSGLEGGGGLKDASNKVFVGLKSFLCFYTFSITHTQAHTHSAAGRRGQGSKWVGGAEWKLFDIERNNDYCACFSV